MNEDIWIDTLNTVVECLIVHFGLREIIHAAAQKRQTPVIKSFAPGR